MPQDPSTQLELFRQAVAALGGQHAAARELPMGERTVRKLLAGESTLHDGILEDMARALIRHADHCRWLERQLSPAFDANRTEAQIKGTANRGRWPAELDQARRRLHDEGEAATPGAVKRAATDGGTDG